MIRVSAGFRAGRTITKASSRLGVEQAPLASLSRAAGDPLPSRGDSTPKKRKRKK